MLNHITSIGVFASLSQNTIDFYGTLFKSLNRSFYPGNTFNTFLQQQQDHWAQCLATLETQASWSRTPILYSCLSIIKHIHSGAFLEKWNKLLFILTTRTNALGQQHPLQAISGQPFVAMGISMILHPHNPFVPTVHANLRYFQTLHSTPTWWFAGVMDLTPTYGFTQDCQHWHQHCQRACQNAHSEDYHAYKKACDRYYHLPHRNEYRGIGGLWIEHLNQKPFSNCQRLIDLLGSDKYLHHPLQNDASIHHFQSSIASFKVSVVHGMLSLTYCMTEGLVLAYLWVAELSLF